MGSQAFAIMPLVYMLHLAFITIQQALIGHDLHELQGGGILHFPFHFVELVIHESYRGWTMLPQNLQNFQFRTGGFWKKIIFPGIFHDMKVGMFSYEQNITHAIWMTGNLGVRKMMI